MAQFNLGRVKGDKGDRGKSFRLRGAWATATEYINDDNTIDVINHSGCAYACKVTHTSSGASPSTEQWELLLSNEFDIVHTDTINDTTKVPSSTVTYALGQEIDTINNNFVQTTGSFAYNEGFSLASRNSIIKMGKLVTLLVGVKKTDGTVFTSGAVNVIGIIPEGFRPKISQMCIVGFDVKERAISKIGYGFIGSDGQIVIQVDDSTSKAAIIQINYLTP